MDWRTIYGKDCIFFGPFAGFKPTVFVNKSGLANVWEWVKTLVERFDIEPFPDFSAK